MSLVPGIGQQMKQEKIEFNLIDILTANDLVTYTPSAFTTRVDGATTSSSIESYHHLLDGILFGNSLYQDCEVVNNNDVYDDVDLIYYAYFADCEPFRFEEAVKDERQVKTMDKEINVTEKNKVKKLMSFSKGHKVIGVKWVYKTKYSADENLDK